MPHSVTSSPKKVVQFNTIHYNQQVSVIALLKAIETLIFKNFYQHQTQTNDLPHQLTQAKHYFYEVNQEMSIESKHILAQLQTVKSKIGCQIWKQFAQIKQEINSNSFGVNNLKYIYGVMKIFSVDQQYIARILTWIYALVTQKNQNQSQILKSIIYNKKKLLINLALSILLTGSQQSLQFQIEKNSLSQKKLQKKFKEIMKKFIKNQQFKNHEQAYEICRICEAHISLHLMHAHLSICKVVHQKGYFQTKIVEKGKQILSKVHEQHLEMIDPLDEKADLQLVFNRVFSTLGDKNVLFQIKEDVNEIQQIIDQFKDNKQGLIRQLAILLEQYHGVIIKKLESGYQSQGDIQSSKKIKGKMRNSRNSIKFSSNSIKTSSQRGCQQTGSQKNIRYEESSCKTIYKLQDYQILKLLGKGAYSQVYLVRNINTQDLFAMKVVQVQSVDGQTLEAFKKQQQIYKTINSDLTVRLYCSFSQENLHFFILDYANGGNLRSLLEDQVYLQQKNAQFYLANLILGIQSLHQLGIIHRDLKPENIVIDQKGFLKLTDFNLAFLLTGVHQQPTDSEKFFGSPDYIAPEVIKSELKQHPSRDIWSLGIIAYEMMVGVTPFTAMDIQEVFQNILKGQIEWPQIGEEDGMISNKAYSFISRLLEPNPKQRLGYNGIQQLKSHQFFDNFSWQNIKNMRSFYIPTRQSLKLIEDKTLKQTICNRKTSNNSLQCPSLDCIIRYDILKSKTSLKARSNRLSRFRIQKQLAQLKRLTSMDNFQIDSYHRQESDKNISSSQNSDTSKGSNEEIGTIGQISVNSSNNKVDQDFSIRVSAPGQKLAVLQQE